MLNLAYVAGIIDGEGWIGFKAPKDKTKKRYLAVVVEVSMTNPTIPYMLSVQFGGSFTESGSRSENRKDQFRWILTGKGAIEFINQIYEFLLVKRKQANLAIAFMQLQELDNSNSSNESVINSFKEKMHELNKRGTMERSDL
jgi:hypothetical protein